MGGNAIKKSVSIKKEFIEPTLNYIYSKFLPKIKISKNDTRILGSVGKKQVSGDIDIAIDFRKIIINNNLAEDYVGFFIYEASGVFSEVIQMKGINVVSVACPIIGETDKFVQVDFMLTDNLEFAEFAYYSPSQLESKYKGLYRNILLYEVLKAIGFKITKEVSGNAREWESYNFNINKGLMKRVQSVEGKKGILLRPKTIKEVPVTKDPETILEIVFGDKIKNIEEINTFEKLFKLITTLKLPFSNKLSTIFKNTANGIHSLGYPIPEEIEKNL